MYVPIAAALANVLRVAVMALVSAIPITLAQEMLDGTLKKLVGFISDEEGLTIEESKDILSNIMVDLILNAAVVGVVMKSKVALKAADYLGFSTRGVVKKKLTGKAAIAAAKLEKSAATKGFKFTLTNILKIVAIPGSMIWLVNAIANIIEPGIYKPEQTNAVYKKLGIPFQYPQPVSVLKPGPFDTDQFKDYAYSLEQVGLKGFNDPFALQSRPYSRQALADLIEGVYGNEILNGRAPSAKQMIPLLAPYLITASGNTGSVTTPQGGSSSQVSTPPVKVFTGNISQSTIGEVVGFTVRPDDLIEDINELKAAIQNNESAWLASLPGKIIRDIKVVSSITTKDGLTQRGTARQIIAGYNSNGTPKYRTVVNKFAVADYYILSDRGTRTKLARIVYGPTDAIKFKPEESELLSLDQVLKGEIAALSPAITSTIKRAESGDLVVAGGENVMESMPVKPPPVLLVDIIPRDYFVNYDAFYDRVYYRDGNQLVTSPDFASIIPLDERAQYVNYGGQTNEAIRRLKAIGYPVDTYYHKKFANEIDGKIAPLTITKTFEEFFGTRITLGSDTTASSLPAEAMQATTLYEYYKAQGKSLPAVSQRALIYETLGLGLASYYTGTTEQNTKLLAKLQGKI